MTARPLRRDQARRLALAAQDLHTARPAGRVDIRHVRRVFRSLDLVQIDAVQTVERAQYVPLFSRLGPYPRELLDDAAYRRRDLFEAWAHEASLVRVERWPALATRRDHWVSGRARRLEAERPGFVDAVLDEVTRRGPLAVSDLEAPGERTGPWWGWSPGKTALEALFARGDLAVAHRRGQTRVYDLTARVIPDGIRARDVPPPGVAARELLVAAARALGVATADDLVDYHRQHGPTVRPVIDDLVAQGELVGVDVDGWSAPAYRWRDARLPRRVAGAALLAPFDPLIWHRPRVERLFGFRYRLEFYVPSARRVYGYYVMPFLLGDDLVARIDVKADRAAGTLRVLGAFAEDGVAPSGVAGPLRAELRHLADWLGLTDIDVADRGDLAGALRAAERAR